MKKVIAIIAASLSFAVLAAPRVGYYTPEIGLFKKKMTLKNNIIPVKHTTLTNRTGNVSVREYVCTNCLPVGTHMFVFKDNNYKAYILDAAEGWKGATVLNTSGLPNANSGDLDEILSVGSGIWIRPPDPVEGEYNVLVLGQLLTATNSTILAGKSNLIANPKEVQRWLDLGGDPSSKATISGPFANGDTILRLRSENFKNLAPDQIVYNSKSNKWYSVTLSGNEVSCVETNKLLIGMYQGLWYVSKGSSNITIDWK